ncbi:MAG: methyltransferase [Burkholderiales bacterium PBB4]|nr:MAG: methyltransferase [Burkholderiales bacterium PBB4]
MPTMDNLTPSGAYPNAAQPYSERMAKLLQRIDPAVQVGLEIGALCRPVVTPEMGAVHYVDHLTTEELCVKYADDADVDVAAIVEVRYVWGERTLLEAVGDVRFDYVLASHVVEHVPDMVGWLREIAAVLRPSGVLSLAIPDKRFTFDARRELTTFASLVEAHFSGRRRPGFREILDHHANAVAVPGQVSAQALWRKEVNVADLPPAHAGLLSDLGEAGLRRYFEQILNGAYMDVHVNVFTPESWLRLLQNLATAGMLDFRVVHFCTTQQDGMEFFVSLEKMPEGGSTGERRAAILESVARWLPD